MRSKAACEGRGDFRNPTKAELARRLASETRDPAAKTGLLELGALLDADADRFEIDTRRDSAAEVSSD
jgi:hypothetical protein